jgi:hypothetical protein
MVRISTCATISAAWRDFKFGSRMNKLLSSTQCSQAASYANIRLHSATALDIYYADSNLYI